MSELKTPKLRRREFLLLGSVGVVWPAVGGWRPLHLAAHGLPTMSVGYWHGGESLPALADFDARCETTDEPQNSSANAVAVERCAFVPDVVAAASLPAGDASFVRRGAEVTIHRLVEPTGSQWRPELEKLAVTAHFKIEDGATEREVPFSMWHLASSPVRNEGSPVQFPIPVDRHTGLRFSLERSASPALVEQVLERMAHGRATESSELSSGNSCQICLSIDAGSSPKLRRGVYFVATDPRAAAHVEWKRLQFRPVRDGNGRLSRRLVQRGWLGLEPVDFEYQIWSLDYASGRSKSLV